MKTHRVVGVMLVSSLLLSGCLSSVYVLSSLETNGLPEMQRDLNAWFSPNPKPSQKAYLQVTFDDKTPSLEQAMPMRLEYQAANCGFKTRSVEGLPEARYPRQTVDIAATAMGKRQYQYVFYQDVFLLKADEYGRTCVWEPRVAQLNFMTLAQDGHPTAQVRVQVFASDWKQGRSINRYFYRQEQHGSHLDVSPKTALANKEQVFAASIRYMPK